MGELIEDSKLIEVQLIGGLVLCMFSAFQYHNFVYSERTCDASMYWKKKNVQEKLLLKNFKG